MRNGHAPTALLGPQRYQPGLPGQHFHGNLQDAPKQLVEVQFLGQRAGNLQQVIALADAKIR